jgi:glycosyltransferase involved in cell wall biosynthesis
VSNPTNCQKLQGPMGHGLRAGLFTVVMPCFRARDTIALALASVLTQSEPDFELVIVDDGSPDDTLDVARRAAGGDRRVRLISQANAGPAAARNHGVNAGTGRLVAFLDADDRWSPDLLARHRDRFAADRSLGLSFARVRFYDPSMNHAGRVSGHVEQLRLARILGENAVCTTSNLVARRAVFDEVGGFDVTMRHAEDQEWLARVLAASDWKACGIDAALVDYRMSADGLSADLGRMQAGWRVMIERVRRYAPVEVANAEAGAEALFERYLARRALRTGQPASDALGHMYAACRRSLPALLMNDPMRTLLTAGAALASLCLPTKHIHNIVRR